MTETVKRRRRWPWGVLAVALLLSVAAGAWIFRPLNAMERKLVGRWTPKQPSSSAFTYTFRPDRTFDWSVPPGMEVANGVWHCSEATIELELVSDRRWSLHRTLSRFFRRISGENRRLLYLDEQGQAVIGSDVYVRAATPST